MKKLLITGVSGLLGNNLAIYFRDKYEVLGMYNAHPVTIKGIYTQKCDIPQQENLKEVISNFKPSVIIHCASLTNIDQCEIDKNSAKLINAVSTQYLVDSIHDDVFLAYISTDAVYDGIMGNFSEKSNIRPQNYYGITKHEGEIEVLKHKNSLIVRTNIFGWNIQDKKSIAEWILGELEAKRKINCFKDAIFSSIYTFELSRAIDIAIQNGLTGIYNCGSSDSCSKYEFALKMADRFGLDKTLITPISIDNFGFKAKRGKNLSLNSDNLQRELSYGLPDIEQSIEEFYKDYKCGLPEEIKQGQKLHQKKYFSIPYGKHWIDENDIQAVVRTLRSEWLTQGPVIERFEHALAEYCGAKYAVAVSSGTAALHLAALAAGIGPGTSLLTSPITFVASANAALYAGGRPVFADIEPDTVNMSPDSLEEALAKNPDTRAIVPVHFAGLPCNMPAIKSAADKAGAVVVEDAAHALGAHYPTGQRVGSCAYSLMTVFSFHPVKAIAAGEGGMITTNDESTYRKLLRLRSHGINKLNDPFQIPAQAATNGVQNPWYYEMQELGFNYRITDIQCGLALSQLKKLDRFIARRRELVKAYDNALEGMRNCRPAQLGGRNQSAHHIYTLRINFDAIGLHRGRLMQELKKRQIGSQVHYIPVPAHPYYRRLGFCPEDYPNALNYYQEALSIPLFYELTDMQQEYIVAALKDLL